MPKDKDLTIYKKDYSTVVWEVFAIEDGSESIIHKIDVSFAISVEESMPASYVFGVYLKGSFVIDHVFPGCFCVIYDV